MIPPASIGSTANWQLPYLLDFIGRDQIELQCDGLSSLNRHQYVQRIGHAAITITASSSAVTHTDALGYHLTCAAVACLLHYHPQSRVQLRVLIKAHITLQIRHEIIDAEVSDIRAVVVDFRVLGISVALASVSRVSLLKLPRPSRRA